jgi:hypothetical protein
MNSHFVKRVPWIFCLMLLTVAWTKDDQQKGAGSGDPKMHSQVHKLTRHHLTCPPVNKKRVHSVPLNSRSEGSIQERL